MTRHGYTDDGEWCEDETCGECDFCSWRERVDSAIATPEAQSFLAELVEVGPKEPGFCSRVLMNEEGAVCAIGAVLKHRGEKLEPEDEDYGSDWAPDEVALLAGIPEELAQEIMHENDEWGGSPEKVRDHMVAWARSRIAKTEKEDEGEKMKAKTVTPSRAWRGTESSPSRQSKRFES